MSNEINIGDFSDLVYLEFAAKSNANDYGESTNSWTAHSTLWSKIEYLSGSSDIGNQVEQNITKIKVTGNYIDYKDLLANPYLYRLKIKDPTDTTFFYFFITEVKPVGFRNREFIEIYSKGRV
tara:strand:+ start:6465 stop:6833 length:369 start_codon:yes stop_codon:yes gene_type:complete